MLQTLETYFYRSESSIHEMMQINSQKARQGGGVGQNQVTKVDRSSCVPHRHSPPVIPHPRSIVWLSATEAHLLNKLAADKLS